MKGYFKLQFQIIYRTVKDWGLDFPLVFIFGFLAIFIGGSNYLITNIQYGNYFLAFIFFQLLYFLSEKERNNFLQINFTKRNYKTIRLLENFLSSIPFLIIEIYNGFYIYTIIALILIGTFSLLIHKKLTTAIIPTPFKYSFEFIFGFRKYFFGFLFCLFLIIMGVKVDNFNLCLFSLALFFVIITTFYGKTEPIHFVWEYSLIPSKFLKHKIKKALINTIVLVSPFYAIVITAFYHQIIYVLASLLGGIIMISFVMIVKYANFSSKIALSYRIGIVISLTFGSLLFPVLIPVLIFMLIVSFKNSLRFLNEILC